MNTRISTQPANPLIFVRRWFAATLARWNERIDNAPMPSHHRMGSWEHITRKAPSE